MLLAVTLAVKFFAIESISGMKAYDLGLRIMVVLAMVLLGWVFVVAKNSLIEGLFLHTFKLNKEKG